MKPWTCWILPLTDINVRLFFFFLLTEKSGDNREIMHDFSRNGKLATMEHTSSMFPSIHQIIFCVT